MNKKSMYCNTKYIRCGRIAWACLFSLNNKLIHPLDVAALLFFSTSPGNLIKKSNFTSFSPLRIQKLLLLVLFYLLFFVLFFTAWSIFITRDRFWFAERNRTRLFSFPPGAPSLWRRTVNSLIVLSVWGLCVPGFSGTERHGAVPPFSRAADCVRGHGRTPLLWQITQLEEGGRCQWTRSGMQDCEKGLVGFSRRSTGDLWPPSVLVI